MRWWPATQQFNSGVLPSRRFRVYQLLKLIHVLAVIIFLGNIITGLFWKRAAYRSLSLRWELWGLFATLTPIAAVALMVLKPHLGTN